MTIHNSLDPVYFEDNIEYPKLVGNWSPKSVSFLRIQVEPKIGTEGAHWPRSADLKIGPRAPS